MVPTGHTDDSFRDHIATVDENGKRKWVFPFKPSGRLYNYRKYLSYVYLLVFFGLPFVKVHGEPLFLVNILERKFILFGMIFWPQDFFIFGIGMLIFIVFIALFTVIFGRVFCGWVCPQTIFMEMLFRRIEYRIDGDAPHQKALAQAPWNRQKIVKRVTKYSLFFLLSFLIANTFLAYIIGMDELIRIATEPMDQHIGGLIAILIFTAVFFFVYSWFREQVCIIVCPYGRMQGVLLDKDSVIVAYDYVRGEERHKFRKNEVRTGGDCIDCNKCVRVCPTGIDIRNGTQLECINCTACIDACDGMMEAVGMEKGLIRFASESGIRNKVKLAFTNRMKAYSAVLLLLIGVESFLLLSRSDFDATVIRAKGMLYQEQPQEKVSNLFTVKLVNKTRRELPVNLKVENFPGASIEVIGKDLIVKKESMTQGSFFIFLDKRAINKRKTELKIGIYSHGRLVKTVKTSFFGPVTH